jgi:hypothetical protein
VAEEEARRKAQLDRLQEIAAREGSHEGLASADHHAIAPLDPTQVRVDVESGGVAATAITAMPLAGSPPGPAQ